MASLGYRPTPRYPKLEASSDSANRSIRNRGRCGTLPARERPPLVQPGSQLRVSSRGPQRDLQQGSQLLGGGSGDPSVGHVGSSRTPSHVLRSQAHGDRGLHGSPPPYGDGSPDGSPRGGPPGGGGDMSLVNEFDVFDDLPKSALFTKREFVTALASLFASVFSLVSLKHPHDTDESKQARLRWLWGLATLYVMSFLGKCIIECRGDSTNGLIYKLRRSLSFFIGVGVVIVSIASSIMSSAGSSPNHLYHMGLLSASLSLALAFVQGWNMDQLTVNVVRDKQGRRVGFLLCSCKETPARGRLVFKEIDAVYPAFRID